MVVLKKYIYIGRKFNKEIIKKEVIMKLKFRGILLHDINRQRSANQCYRLALKGIFFKILTTSYNLKWVYQIVKGFFFLIDKN